MADTIFLTALPPMKAVDLGDGTYAVAAKLMGGSLSDDIDLSGHDIENVGDIEATSITAPTGRTSTYVIAASNAPAHVKAHADYVCDGVDDQVEIQAAITTLGQSGKVVLSEGTFTTTGEILFPRNYNPYNTIGIILEGQGNRTRISYTSVTGYALALDAELSVADSKTSNNHQIRDMVILAPNTTDGAILLRGAYYNTFKYLFLECANGIAIKLMANTYGSRCYFNKFESVSVRANSKGAFHSGADEAVTIFDRCNFTTASNGTPTVYNGSGLIWATFTQFKHPGGVTESSLTTVATVNTFVGCYNDGGQLNISGGRMNAYGCNLTVFKPTDDCIYDISTSYNYGHKYYDFPGIHPPPNFINRGVPCSRDVESTAGVGVKTADVLASNGYAMANILDTAKNYVFDHRYNFYNYLPRGRYLLQIRLKDTHQVARDALLRVYNITDSVALLDKSLTLTASYKTYSYPFTISATDNNDDMRIRVYKNTTTQNTIYADFYKLIYLGTEWDDSYPYSITGVTTNSGTDTITRLAAPAALTAAASTAGDVDLGDHSWKVTFVNAEGEETDLGTKSNVVTIAGTTKRVSLTNVPIGPAGTVFRRIYRTEAGDAGDYKLFGQVNNNTSTTSTDNIADAALGAVGPATNGTGYARTVTHGLSTTPARAQVTLTSDPGAANTIWVSDKGATTFKVNAKVQVTTSTTFDWRASLIEGD